MEGFAQIPHAQKNAPNTPNFKDKLKNDLLTPRRRSVRLTEKLTKTQNKEETTNSGKARGSKPSTKDENKLQNVACKENTDSNISETDTAEDVEIRSDDGNSHSVNKGENGNAKNLHTDVLTELNSAIVNSDNKTSSTAVNVEKNNPIAPLSLERKTELDVKNKMTGSKNNPLLTTKRLGRIKSGRFWKMERDRFRSNVKSKGLKQVSAQKRIAQKQQILRVREYEKSLKEDVKRLREEKKQRTEENKKRKAENEKKNEIVQVIKNPAKIKRMKKKQLRMLAKRDVTIV